MNTVLNKKVDLGSRIIFNPYTTSLKKDKINIVVAPTGVGKTHTIVNELLPQDLKEGYNKFIFVTAFKDSVDQEYETFDEYQMENSQLLKITKDVQVFLDHDKEYPILLITTLAGAVNGGGLIQKNGDKLVDFLTDKPFVVYWDEAHFGASSSKETTIFNCGAKQSNYKASYFGFAWKLVTIGGKVTAFTATPVVEHFGILDTNYYNIATDMKLWPSQSELSYVSSQTRGIVKYDLDFETYYDALNQGVGEFLTFTENQKIAADKIGKYEPNLKLHTKGLCQVVCATSGADDTKTGVDLKDVKKYLFQLLKDKGYKDAQVAIATSDKGYEIFNVKSGKKVKKPATFKQFKKELESPHNNVIFLLTIEKFKYGLNIPNIVSQVHLRLRAQSGIDNDHKVTVSILQTFGRAVRTFYGVQDLFFYNVADAVKWVVNNYSSSKVFKELVNFMKNSNSHHFTIPASDKYATYLKGAEEWETKYSAPMSMSLFNMIDGVGVDTDDNTNPLCEQEDCDVCGGTGKKPKTNIVEDTNYDGLNNVFQMNG